MQKIFRRLSAALLCLALLAAPALAAEATIRSDYVVIEGENFVADTFCGVDALYNETGRTLFCNELIERFYSAVYGVSSSTSRSSVFCRPRTSVANFSKLQPVMAMTLSSSA